MFTAFCGIVRDLRVWLITMQISVCAIINWLHSAETVWRLQRFFGVKKSNPNDVSFRITNWFFYYLFKFGSMLGQEEFYSLLFPFWFWNLDVATGRKLMFIWMVGMYIGQTLKDHFRQPRPKSPPAVQLETIFLSEYGLPSTHAIVGVCIPYCAVHFETDRCHFPAYSAVLFATTIATLVCVSRIYMGMHTILEVLVGITISFSVMGVFVPNADWLDAWYMESWVGPLVVTLVALVCAYIYPHVDNKFTPAWSDSVAILASTTGVLFGSWTEYKTGVVETYVENMCKLIWPEDLYSLFLMLAKTLIGLFVILTIKESTKIIFYRLMSIWYKTSIDELKRTKQSSIELPGKFLSYYVVGFQVFFTPACTHFIKSVVM